MPRYLYRVDKTCFGPIEVQELKRRFINGEVDQSTAFVMREDGDKWIPASKLTFKSDPRRKSASLSGKTPSTGSVEIVVEEEEVEEVEEVPERPLNAPPASSRPMLWNPSLASFWSILFSAAFGSYVHARNWEILNKPEKATTNWIFFWATLVAEFLKITSMLLARNSATFLRLAMILHFILLLTLIVWYISVARPLTLYIRRRFPKGYRPRPWPTSWISVAGAFFVVHLIAQVNLELGVSGNFDQFFINARSGSLAEARRGFKTKLVGAPSPHTPPAEPPPGVLDLVRYDSPVGKLSAYLTPDPGDGKKRPAIIWITGGDCNSIDNVWEHAPVSNDQTAAAYRNAGIVTMYPSLRGGNDNPGRKECFLGEVDDVLAAADYLATQRYVDPKRIYLGGHSTGGTLALLTAECSKRFRAVFSFGPTHDIRGYGDELGPFSSASAEEIRLRSPGGWLAGIQTPTFVIEGAAQGNAVSLAAMKAVCKNSLVRFLTVTGGTHFNILAPTNALIAQRILQDNSSTCNIAFEPDDLVNQLASANAFNRMPSMPPHFQHPPMTPPPEWNRPFPQDPNQFPRNTAPRLRTPPNGAQVPPPSTQQDELHRPDGMTDDEWIDQLAAELNKEDGSNRWRMAKLVEELADTKNERAIEPIVRKVSVFYPDAEQALAPFGAKAERVILKELKSAKDDEYVRRLADALGQVGTKASIPTLKTLTKHPYAFVRIASESSINKITRRRFSQR